MSIQQRCRYCRDLFLTTCGHRCPQNRLGDRVPKEPEAQAEDNEMLSHIRHIEGTLIHTEYERNGLSTELAETQAKLAKATGIKDQLEIVRRIAERGLAQALNQKWDADVWQHLLDELERVKNALAEVVK